MDQTAELFDQEAGKNSSRLTIGAMKRVVRRSLQGAYHYCREIHVHRQVGNWLGGMP